MKTCNVFPYFFTLSPSLHPHMQLHTVFPAENTTVPFVLPRQALFSGRDRTQHPGSGSTDSLRLSQLAHSYFCYVNSHLFVLKNQSGGWLCLHLLASVRRAHCLQCEKHEEGQQATRHSAQEPSTCHNSTLALWEEKTVGEEKQTWRTGSQVTFNQCTASNCWPVPLIHPLSSGSLEIPHWHDGRFEESVHLPEQHLWQGEETEGKEFVNVFVIFTRSGNSKLRIRL